MSNSKNQDFYRNLGPDRLDEFAKSGFGDGGIHVDLEQLLKLLQLNKRILEVGAGTGRIGLELIRRGFDYTGVEPQEDYLERFKEKLKTANIKLEERRLILGTFESLPQEEIFDFILFPWTVIVDFSFDEQRLVLEKAYRHLTKEGTCILDNPAKNQPYNTHPDHCATPFYHDEWHETLSKIGFRKQRLEIYRTGTGRRRELVIIEK